MLLCLVCFLWPYVYALLSTHADRQGVDICDAASFILGREIRKSTNTHKKKTRTNSKRYVYCLFVCFCVCVCVFVRLWISPPRIKQAASHFAQRFIGVQGRESQIFVNFAPPEAPNRTNRWPARPHVNITVEMH